LTAIWRGRRSGGDFQRFCAIHKIKLHFIPAADQLGTAFVERFNRTMRILLEKLKVSQGSNVWLKFLPELLENYNGGVHRVFGSSPVEALRRGMMTSGDAKYVHKRYEIAEQQPLNAQNLTVCDRVKVG